MITQTMASTPRGDIRQSFRLVGPVLGVGLLLLGLLFHAEIAAAVGVWVDSTAYNHCFLILPIVAYLVWDRRDRLAKVSSVPNAWFALAAIPVMLVWLVAERLGLMEGRQLMVMTLVEVFFLSVLGWRLSYQFAGPLLYLYFLVPFGAFITPALQGFTTSFVVHGLNVLNIPNYSDGYTIEIPQGSFLVAEACAGLRFLIASVAFGCLYAMLMYRSPLRRAIFILVSIVVPIIANGFRALGIVVLGHILGNAQAAVADHLIYGWLFFSVVILLQIVLGLPFRQDHREPTVSAPASNTDPAQRAASRAHPIRPVTRSAHGHRRQGLGWDERILSTLRQFWSGVAERSVSVPQRPMTVRGLSTAAAAAVLLSAIGPAAATVLNSRTGADLPATLQPIAFAGACITDPNRVTEQHDGVGRVWMEHLKCGEQTFTLQIEVLPPSATPATIISSWRTLSGESGADVAATTYIATESGPRTWSILEFGNPAGTVAASLWVNGQPTQQSFNMRLHQAWASVVGSSYAPVMITLKPDLDWSKPSVELRDRARDLITTFVQAYRSLPDQVLRLSAAASR